MKLLITDGSANSNRNNTATRYLLIYYPLFSFIFFYQRDLVVVVVVTYCPCKGECGRPSRLPPLSIRMHVHLSFIPNPLLASVHCSEDNAHSPSYCIVSPFNITSFLLPLLPSHSWLSSINSYILVRFNSYQLQFSCNYPFVFFFLVHCFHILFIIRLSVSLNVLNSLLLNVPLSLCSLFLLSIYFLLFIKFFVIFSFFFFSGSPFIGL